MEVQFSQHTLLGWPLLLELLVIASGTLPGVEKIPTLSVRPNQIYACIDGVPGLRHHRRIHLLLGKDCTNIVLYAVCGSHTVDKAWQRRIEATEERIGVKVDKPLAVAFLLR